MATPQPDVDDYSPSSTIITFDPPIPLLRRPVPASSDEDPLAAGSLVLAFKDAHSFTAGYEACESKLTSQCEAGARIGCAIAASKNCRIPWWKSLFSKPDYEERERCEEREMSVCVVAAKEGCGKFVKEKCMSGFRDARIAGKVGKLHWKEASNNGP